MKITTSLLLLATSVGTFAQTFSFSFPSNPLSAIDFTGGNGSFAADAYKSPSFSGALEVGGLGLANGGGQMSITLPEPMDFTRGFGSLGDSRQTNFVMVPNPQFDPSRPIGPFNPATIPQSQGVTGGIVETTFSLEGSPGIGKALWHVYVYDGDGDRYYFILNPTWAIGQVQTVSAKMQNAPGMNWNRVTRIVIGGDGGTDQFHALFTTLTLVSVPEPRHYAAVAGAALLAFGYCRSRMRRI